MGYRDPAKRRAAARDWYHRNKSDPERRSRRHARASRTKYAKRRELQARVTELKVSRGCALCGIKHPAVLQFHHTRGEKAFEIAIAVAQCFAWERIEEEIAKCDVVCANCHHKAHARRSSRLVPKRVRKEFLHEE